MPSGDERFCLHCLLIRFVDGGGGGRGFETNRLFSIVWVVENYSEDTSANVLEGLTEILHI